MSGFGALFQVLDGPAERNNAMFGSGFRIFFRFEALFQVLDDCHGPAVYNNAFYNNAFYRSKRARLRTAAQGYRVGL